MNQSNPAPLSASRQTRDEDEIQVPKDGSRDERSRLLSEFFMGRTFQGIS
ncbi:MAG: hypothetical protein WA761_02630 [Thermoplasmata archaeon]